MTDEKIRTFKSGGMIWDDGEIPVCSYCNKNIDEVDGLFETPYSGELCCNNINCKLELAEQGCDNEVEETTDN